MPGGGFTVPPGFPGGYSGQFGEHAVGELAIPPLLNYAPGQPIADYGTGPQLPREQPFFYSAAEMAAAGVSAAPAFIYGMQEAQGQPVQDLIGAADLAPAGSGAYVPLQGLPARGIYHDSSFIGATKKCVDFEDNLHLNRLQAANNTIHNFGTDSFCCFIVFRLGNKPGAARQIVSKKNTTTGVGWVLVLGSAVSIVIEEAGGSNGTSQHLNAESWYGGHWNYAFFYLDRSTSQMRLRTSRGDGAIISTAGWGSVDSTSSFTIGQGVYNAPFLQVPYMAGWLGANAEAIIAADAANINRLWTHGRPAPDTPVDQTAYDYSNGVWSGIITTIVGEDEDDGIVAASWGGRDGGADEPRQYPFEYNPALSHAGQLGIATQKTDQNITLYSDNLMTSWVVSNMARTSDYNLMETAPDGQHYAIRLQSLAAGAHIETADMTCSVGQHWAFGVFVIRNRALEGADVEGCRLIAWNDNANNEIASVTFDATDKWQWIPLHNIIIPAGCVDIQMWIEAPHAGTDRYINAVRATAIRTDMMCHPTWRQNTILGNSSRVEAELNGLTPGEFIKGAQGEIEVVFVAIENYIDASKTLYVCEPGAGSGNMREVRVNTSKQIEFIVNNSVGVPLATVTSGIIADLTTLHVAVCRWNILGLPSGNKIEVSVDGGAYVGINPAAWPVSDTVVRHIYGDDQGNDNALNGTLASIRVWENPR